MSVFFTDPQPIFTGHVQQADQTLRSARGCPKGNHYYGRCLPDGMLWLPCAVLGSRAVLNVEACINEYCSVLASDHLNFQIGEFVTTNA